MRNHVAAHFALAMRATIDERFRLELSRHGLHHPRRLARTGNHRCRTARTGTLTVVAAALPG